VFALSRQGSRSATSEGDGLHNIRESCHRFPGAIKSDGGGALILHFIYNLDTEKLVSKLGAKAHCDCPKLGTKCIHTERES